MQRIANSPFIDGNPSTHTQGTVVTAAWLTAVQEEVAGAIEGLGGVINPANNGQLLAQLLAKFYLKATGEAFGGIESVAGAGTLDATYAGKLTVLSGTTYSLALPSASSYPEGSTLTFFSMASGPITLVRAGADTISLNNVINATSQTLNSGDTLTYVSNGGTSWYAVAGSTQLGASAAFGSSLAINGWQKLPSGLIIQWGRASIATNGSIITLPIAFPYAHLKTFASYGDSQSAGTADTRVGTAWCGLRTLTNFVGKYQTSDGVNTATTLYDWLAIGH